MWAIGLRMREATDRGGRTGARQGHDHPHRTCCGPPGISSPRGRALDAGADAPRITPAHGALQPRVRAGRRRVGALQERLSRDARWRSRFLTRSRTLRTRSAPRPGHHRKQARAADHGCRARRRNVQRAARGKQTTYRAARRRAPTSRRLTRDEALGELAALLPEPWSGHDPRLRLVVGPHGERCAAQPRDRPRDGRVVDDLAYWSIGAVPARKKPRPGVHLLPIYDEYLVVYRDLHAVPRRAGRGGGLQPAVVGAGQVAGTWKPVRTTNGVVPRDHRRPAAERERAAEPAAGSGALRAVSRRSSIGRDGVRSLARTLVGQWIDATRTLVPRQSPPAPRPGRRTRSRSR